MSALYNQTNLTAGTAQFITRSEVIQGLSTLAGDLSGVNFSTFFNQPNPTFSTITMNPTGNISLPAGVNTQVLTLSTVGSIKAVQPYGTSFTGVGVQGSAPNLYGDLYARNFGAMNGFNNTSNNQVLYSYQGIQGITSNATVQALAGWNPANPLPWNLTNVSTINGIPPNVSGTTFTTLTGNTLTANTQVITPTIASITSINASAYKNNVTAAYIGGGSISIPNNTTVTAITVTLPALTLVTSKPYLFSIPVIIGPFPPSPTGFQLNLGVRLGANGVIAFVMNYWVAANSNNPITISLSGIAFTNVVSVATQTLEVVATQLSGSTLVIPITNPVSGANNNSYNVKLLT